jgi:hypothetical protein
MSCAILANADDTLACFFCDTSSWAFGPVFYDRDSATEQAEAFRQSLDRDPREYTECDLESRYLDWNRGI